MFVSVYLKIYYTIIILYKFSSYSFLERFGVFETFKIAQE